MAKQKEELFEDEMIDHVVTEEDLIVHPELSEQGIEEGDTIGIPKDHLDRYNYETKEPEVDVAEQPEAHVEAEAEQEVSQEVTPTPVVDASLPDWMKA
jgi:hypothetical protein